MKTDDYLQGQNDCKDGVPHEMGKSKDYHDGYATQYEAEQLLTEMGIRQNEQISS